MRNEDGAEGTKQSSTATVTEGHLAVKRHFRLSCVAQSLLQQVAAPASKSEKFEFAKGQITFGQRLRAVTREIFGALLARAQQLFAQGQSCKEVLEALMPT